jgi:hypothetical protein
MMEYDVIFYNNNIAPISNNGIKYSSEGCSTERSSVTSSGSGN